MFSCRILLAVRGVSAFSVFLCGGFQLPGLSLDMGLLAPGVIISLHSCSSVLTAPGTGRGSVWFGVVSLVRHMANIPVGGCCSSWSASCITGGE